MPSKILTSNFALSGAVDTLTTLNSGIPVVTTTLLADINSSQSRYLSVVSATGAPRDGGIIEVDGEAMYYGAFDPSSPTKLFDLQRGVVGTAAASHVAGATVTICGQAKFGNPAIPAAIIAMQQRQQFQISLSSATQAANILAGATQEIAVTFTPAMPNTAYTAVALIEAATNILGSATVQGIKAGSKTVNGCTVVVKNTGLSTILSGAITVNVLAYTLTA